MWLSGMKGLWSGDKKALYNSRSMLTDDGEVIKGDG